MIPEFCENSRPKTSANKKHFQFSFKILKCFLFELTQKVFGFKQTQEIFDINNKYQWNLQAGGEDWALFLNWVRRVKY